MNTLLGIVQNVQPGGPVLTDVGANFLIFLAFLLLCALISAIMPALLHPNPRCSHPFVHVRKGRNILGEQIDNADGSGTSSQP